MTMHIEFGKSFKFSEGRKISAKLIKERFEFSKSYAQDERVCEKKIKSKKERQSLLHRRPYRKGSIGKWPHFSSQIVSVKDHWSRKPHIYKRERICNENGESVETKSTESESQESTCKVESDKVEMANVEVTKGCNVEIITSKEDAAIGSKESEENTEEDIIVEKMATLSVGAESNKVNKNCIADIKAADCQGKEVEKTGIAKDEQSAGEQPKLYVPPFLREGYRPSFKQSVNVQSFNKDHDNYVYNCGYKSLDKYHYQFNIPSGERYRSDMPSSSNFRIGYSFGTYQPPLYRPAQIKNNRSSNVNYQSPIYRPDMVSSRVGYVPSLSYQSSIPNNMVVTGFKVTNQPHGLSQQMVYKPNSYICNPVNLHQPDTFQNGYQFQRRPSKRYEVNHLYK
nr:hypothetical transcript [Hymenolepis microstoma]